jgi:enamidase
MAARRSNQLHRLIIGNDAPSGAGVLPLGIIRTVSFIASITNIAAEKVVAALQETRQGSSGFRMGLSSLEDLQTLL